MTHTGTRGTKGSVANMIAASESGETSPCEHVGAQRTVVTEPRGRLAGRRVVRGHEAECNAYHGLRATAPRPAARRRTS